MTTAIIGTGNIGSIIAQDLAAGGEDLIIAGHDLDKAAALAAAVGGSARSADVRAAITAADVVILAVWFDVSKKLIDENSDVFDGKIVVDPSNPLGPDGKGGFVKIIAPEESSGQILAAKLPAGASLVKAFGTLGAESLKVSARQDPAIALLYATDDTAAGDAVASLIRTAGFAPVNVGGLDQSVRIEVYGELHEIGGLGKTVTEQEARAAL